MHHFMYGLAYQALKTEVFRFSFLLKDSEN